MPRRGLAVLGYESHSMEQIQTTEIGSGGLRTPRDLDFNPMGTGELWVVNRDDDSTVTYFEAGTAQQREEKHIDPFALHFMEEVSSVAFGAPGTFATCQESRNTYNDQAAPNDFMGPALWSSDMMIYAHSNPDAVRGLGYDLGSHLDMLHESPLCMGIAWERDNIYWTFDGMTGSISRYDFQMDHGPGWDDHSDGIIERYAVGQVARVDSVPSHLEYDRVANKLYIADTGNARIAILDPSEYTRDRSLPVKEPGTQLWRMAGPPDLVTLIDSARGEFMQPSGLALKDGILYVTDFVSGRITAFNVDTGERLDWLDTGLTNALMGITLDAEGRIYVIDAATPRVFRIAPR
jgi:outer membrane protein assembly factor BamB